MNTFRDDELVTVNGKNYPVVGSRLRLAHEGNQHLSVSTEIVRFDVGEIAVVRCTVTTGKGQFAASGVATVARDLRLQDALLELAETRSIARALRFAGYGVEFTSAEEVGDLFTGSQVETRPEVASLRVVGGTRTTGNGEQAPKTANRQKGTPATGSQQKAIFALGKRLGLTPDQAVGRVFAGVAAKDLGIADASTVIDTLKKQVGNGNGEARQ